MFAPRAAVEGSWILNGLAFIWARALADARSFNGSVNGRGDDVLIYRGSRGVANIEFSGSSNFAVWFYTQNSSDLLVNEIGSYRGQAVFDSGPALVAITGESGTWSIKVK